MTGWRTSNPYRGPSVWKWWTWWPYYFRCWAWTRYNYVRIPTLNPTWSEPEERILHACMTLLVEFVEKQAGEIDWKESIGGHAKAYAEMMEIYFWWKTGRAERERKLSSSLMAWSDSAARDGETKFTPVGDGTTFRMERPPESNETRMLWEEMNRLESEAEAEDKAMLHRLIEIREYLWT